MSGWYDTGYECRECGYVPDDRALRGGTCPYCFACRRGDEARNAERRLAVVERFVRIHGDYGGMMERAQAECDRAVSLSDRAWDRVN